MKLIRLLLAFLVLSILRMLSPSAFAQDISYRPGGDMAEFLKLLNASGGPKIMSEYLCSSELQGLSIRNCQARTPRVLAAHQHSLRQVHALQRQVAWHAKRHGVVNNVFRRREIARIQQTLKCIRQKLHDVDLTCVHRSGCHKQTVAFANTGQQRIYICPSYFPVTIAYQGAVLVHEASHFCGARDERYFNNPTTIIGKPPATIEEPRRISLGRQSIVLGTRTRDVKTTNADTYEYWAMHGFCLPGHDC
jgi:hypothetical protein